MSANPAWGLTGEQFLVVEVALLAAAAIFALHRFGAVVGRAPGASGDPADLGTYDLALLAGGRQRAITSAATQLLEDGLLTSDPDSGLLATAGELDDSADALERAVFQAVRRAAPMAPDAMREEVAAGAELAALEAELEREGLLLDEGRRARLRWLWVPAALVVALGAVRLLTVADDAPVGLLMIVALAAFGVASWGGTVRHRRLTARGHALVGHWRDGCAQLAHEPGAGQGGLVAALFGGAGLWLAAPQIAETLGVAPDDQASGRVSRSRCGAAGCGGGGDGGGGGCGGCGG